VRNEDHGHESFAGNLEFFPGPDAREMGEEDEEVSRRDTISI
jgi:hypothetical protein